MNDDLTPPIAVPPWSSRLEQYLATIARQLGRISETQDKQYITQVNQLVALNSIAVAMQQLAGPEDAQLVTLVEQMIELLTPAPPPPPGPAVAFRITVED